jgi:hypothetical protein
MTAVVTLSTDEGGVVASHTIEEMFAQGSDSRPVAELLLRLDHLEGQLVRLDVRGEVTLREEGGPSIGPLACAAKLVGREGEEPVEFVGWRADEEALLHPGAVGPASYTWRGEQPDAFSYVTAGWLWSVFRAPAAAKLRLALRPLTSTEVSDTPQPARPGGSATGGIAAHLLASGEGPAPDVFLYMIDTLRADHLGCYGYERSTSPNIDAFAAQATLYEDVHAAATWTRPSVATILTGLYPSVHAAMRWSDGLAEWPALLPEVLQNAGYSTLAVVTNPTVTPVFGFNQGYDEFEYRYYASARWVNARVAEHLARMDADGPVFVQVHTMEPHQPYVPAPASLRLFDRGFEGKCDGSLESLAAVGSIRPGLSSDDVEHLKDLYDAEILDADSAFAQFLDLLRTTGRFDDALIVLLSDHGEAFAEHDTLGHSHTLSREELHVPLIVKFPQGRHAGARVGARDPHRCVANRAVGGGSEAGTAVPIARHRPVGNSAPQGRRVQT